VTARGAPGFYWCAGAVTPGCGPTARSTGRLRLCPGQLSPDGNLGDSRGSALSPSIPGNHMSRRRRPRCPGARGGTCKARRRRAEDRDVTILSAVWVLVSACARPRCDVPRLEESCTGSLGKRCAATCASCCRAHGCGESYRVCAESHKYRIQGLSPARGGNMINATNGYTFGD
jgi:hypothetical protein